MPCSEVITDVIVCLPQVVMVEQQVIKSHEAMYSYFYHNPNDVEWSNQWSLVSHNRLLHCRDNHQCILS